VEVDCHICADNARADAGAEPWSVARLETGYVRLNPNQYFTGSTFFLTKVCVHELHQLDRSTRLKHLDEMAEVSAAIFTAFSPRKLNYEALGNGAPHLHWWLTPRYAPAIPGVSPPSGRTWSSCGPNGRVGAALTTRAGSSSADSS
jgi:diadenosine tetraphosphate (Ap4A) HIT family hydrolase